MFKNTTTNLTIENALYFDKCNCNCSTKKANRNNDNHYRQNNKAKQKNKMLNLSSFFKNYMFK